MANAIRMNPLNVFHPGRTQKTTPKMGLVPKLLGCLVTIALLTSCGKRGSDPENDKNPSTGNESAQDLEIELAAKEYFELVESAKNGNSDAAYRLYQMCAYGSANYGLAYYWCVKAKELGHPNVTDRDVRLAEMNIWSEAESQKERTEKNQRK